MPCGHPLGYATLFATYGQQGTYVEMPPALGAAQVAAPFLKSKDGSKQRQPAGERKKQGQVGETYEGVNTTEVTQEAGDNMRNTKVKDDTTSENSKPRGDAQEPRRDVNNDETDEEGRKGEGDNAGEGERKRGEEEVPEDSRKEDTAVTSLNNDANLVPSDDDKTNSEMVRALDEPENNRVGINTPERENMRGRKGNTSPEGGVDGWVNCEDVEARTVVEVMTQQEPTQ